MPGDFRPTSLENTSLLARLKKPFRDEVSTKLAASLAESLPEACRLAADQMKLMPVLHPEFTLHDDTHLLRVTELMVRVMPERVLEETLNPVEIALLILAAHFHDVGMVPDSDEVARIRQSDQYSLARQNWLIDYVGFNDALRIIENKESNASDVQRSKHVVAEFEQAAFAHFIRSTHATRSSDFVKVRLGKDERLRVGTGHLADSLALLCVSHNWPPERISDGQGFHYDKAIGTFAVNLAYLATVLRLADILDFDRERTPDELYRVLVSQTPSVFRNGKSIAKSKDGRSTEMQFDSNVLANVQNTSTPSDVSCASSTTNWPRVTILYVVSPNRFHSTPSSFRRELMDHECEHAMEHISTRAILRSV
jgi:hypothetical protein